MSLQISATYQGNAAVLKVDGRLEDESRKLLDAVNQQLQEGRKTVVLDLSGALSMNSMGLGTIVTAYTKVSNEGGKFVIANPSKRVRDILQITIKDSLFDRYDTVDAALAALGSHKP
jgi:anti-sigma B factor antagonist